MILTICLLILIYSITGKSVKPLLEKLQNTDWKGHCEKAWGAIKEYATKAGRFACEPLLKLWFVLDDPKTSTWEKAMIYAAIIYTVSPVSVIPSYLYKLLGILDEGFAIIFVVKKVRDKMNPAIENKVKDTLEEWFGPEYTVSDAKA